MQPSFIVKANQNDITDTLQKRLISINVTDETGIQSDTLEIRLDDRDQTISLPRTGAELSVYLGYDNKPKRVGLFTVDELVTEGPPDTLTIRARAANFRDSLKEKKERSWETLTLSDIVTKIASEHELTPAIESTLGKEVITHIDQTNESDLHFITRLAKQYDAISTIKQNRLIMTPRGQGKTISGNVLPTLILTPENLTRYRFTLADRGKYVAVIAYWHNTETAQKESIRAGNPEGKPVYTLRGLHPDADAAKAAARGKLNSLERGSITGLLTLPGNPQLKAETPLTLNHFHTTINGTWVVTRAEHSLDKSGFLTKVNVVNKEIFLP